mmetsp:Transcript_16551/g.49363  ORF Transcript_16551/g.49363 Transcript_16551/m.49363 type:complete len:449 (-) Transcript_16551:2563-3909(-)
MAQESEKHEAEKAVHLTVQQQLDKLRADMGERSRQTTTAHSNESHALIKKLQVLEASLKEKEKLLQATMPKIDQAASCQISHNMLNPSDGAYDVTLLRKQLATQQAKLDAWSHSSLHESISTAWQALQGSNATGFSMDGPKMTADSVGKLVFELSQHLVRSKQALARKDAEILKLSTLLESMDAQCKTLSAQLNDKGLELHNVRVEKMSTERQFAVLAVERDSLRQALEMQDGARGKKLQHGHSSDHSGVAKLAELQDLQLRVAALQHQHDAAVQAEASHRQAAAEANNRANAAETRYSQLEKEADSLANKVSALQDKLGCGEFNRSSVRVLHFKMNPEAQFHRQQNETALSELRTENQVLKTRLAEIASELQRTTHQGSTGTATADGTCSERASEGGVHAIAVRDAQLAVLKNRLKEMEKGMIRLKEVTKERIFAFREACYCLFGYR